MLAAPVSGASQARVSYTCQGCCTRVRAAKYQVNRERLGPILTRTRGYNNESGGLTEYPELKTIAPSIFNVYAGDIMANPEAVPLALS
jgi:hypothetical protein